jgi:hypothetical protein
MNEETYQRTVAIHEAGHAVAAIQHGLGLESVTIVPDEEAAGRVTTEAFDEEGPYGFAEQENLGQAFVAVQVLLQGHDEEAKNLEKAVDAVLELISDGDTLHLGKVVNHMIVLFAGYEAAHQIMGADLQCGCEDGNHFCDYYSGSLILDSFTGSEKEQDALIDYAKARTRSFLSRPDVKQKVIRVADGLEKQKTLDADQVREHCRAVTQELIAAKSVGKPPGKGQIKADDPKPQLLHTSHRP